METVERGLTCQRCGSTFSCSRDNIAACWCNAEPYRLPMPVPADANSPGANNFNDCLCPACLRNLAARLKAEPAAAGRVP